MLKRLPAALAFALCACATGSGRMHEVPKGLVHVTFRGFEDGELRAADAAMVVPSTDAHATNGGPAAGIEHRRLLGIENFRRNAQRPRLLGRFAFFVQRVLGLAQHEQSFLNEAEIANPGTPVSAPARC